MKRLIKSFLYAFRGVLKSWREEQNLQLQTLAALVMISLGWYVGISAAEWSALVIVISLVLITEMANSAVERITDVLKPRINGYVKEIKDIMAGAVMLASVAAIIVGAIVFIPYFI